LLLTPDTLSSANLDREGVPEHAIRFVGNVMIDTLESHRSKAEAMNISVIVRENLLEEGNKASLIPDQYVLMTMHRPSNVDDREILEGIVGFLLDDVCTRQTLIWPMHPRTRKQLKQFGLWTEVEINQNIVLLRPVNYHEMLRLNMSASCVLTDSGGLQEECCVLGTPCLTLRWNTERPITLREQGGTSALVGNDVVRMREEYIKTFNSERTPTRPELWDGHAAERCLQAILEF